VRISIFMKIFFAQLLVIVALAGLILGLSLRRIEQHHTSMQADGLMRIAKSLETPFAEGLKHGDTGLLDSLAKHVGAEIGTRITIVDNNGDVLAESQHNPDLMERHRTRPEIMTALRGETGISKRHSTTIGESFLYVAIPIMSGNEAGAVLRVSLPVSDIEQSLSQLRSNIIILTSVVVLLGLLGALISSRTLTRPVRQLSAASKKMASGDFKTRVLLRNRDELRELADSFNEMAEHLEVLFGELSKTGEELRSIVAAIQDGLTVLDVEGKIILTNESFRRMVGLDDIEGRPFWEVIRAAEFGDLVKSISDGKHSQVQEISLGDRMYLCSGSYLGSLNGVVVIIHDITEMKDVEKVKKDFVVNLSHELRTPLTAIRGFLEILEGEVSDNGARYLNVIRRHTARLTSIVEDLLLLSELEDRQTRLEIEDVSLSELVGSVLRIFEQPASEKGLRVEIIGAGAGPKVKGDRFKLEQVFINLVANAVKYTEGGGVTVTLSREDSGVVVTVEDTGIGISEEHLSRIFERFYVVDKSRSRRVGGTGLGLSIVKHIVLLHNGSVNVESTPGLGTKFTVRLPETPV
jgi:two-component system phosphate regulon sensor histidine kinase PhoR